MFKISNISTSNKTSYLFISLTSSFCILNRIRLYVIKYLLITVQIRLDVFHLLQLHRFLPFTDDISDQQVPKQKKKLFLFPNFNATTLHMSITLHGNIRSASAYTCTQTQSFRRINIINKANVK